MAIDTIVNQLELQVEKLLKSQENIVLGINGLDCSGKTTVANALLHRLRGANLSVELLHVDDYNNRPAQARLYSIYEAGDFDAQNLDEYYHQSVVYEDFIHAISVNKSSYSVLIVEGVFLFKSVLKNLFDLKVFIDTDFDVARQRYQSRKTLVGDTRPTEVFDDIWLPSYQRYLSEERPLESADLVVFN